VEFAATLAQAAQDAGVRFINVSLTHALEAANRSAYAQSKRDGVAAVDAVEGMSCVFICSRFMARLSQARCAI
jgi:hypothetical protein